MVRALAGDSTMTSLRAGLLTRCAPEVRCGRWALGCDRTVADVRHAGAADRIGCSPGCPGGRSEGTTTTTTHRRSDPFGSCTSWAHPNHTSRANRTRPGPAGD